LIRESWLAELSPGAPCGPDLEYDPDFLALARAAQGKPEQQYGETIIPAEEPVWPEVVELASAALERTRDIRVVHLLARGLTHTQGLPGFVEAVSLLRDLMDKFWEPLHPRLVIDGEADPVMRMNALAAFADREGTLRDLRAADLLRTPDIAFSLRDVENVLDPAIGKSKTGLGADQLRAAIADIIAADGAALSETETIIAAFDGISATLLQHLEPSMLPDFEPLTSLLKPIAHLVAEVRAQAQGVPGADGTWGVGAAGAAGSGTGDLRTRDDALRALDRVCDFLARSEPTNPAPLLIRRAQRVMTMPFMDIIRDLAPDAAGQVAMITGVKSDA
jgi:type VI secretion system protein ImpA